jgi:hypothetical protein
LQVRRFFHYAVFFMLALYEKHGWSLEVILRQIIQTMLVRLKLWLYGRIYLQMLQW